MPGGGCSKVSAAPRNQFLSPTDPTVTRRSGGDQRRLDVGDFSLFRKIVDGTSRFFHQVELAPLEFIPLHQVATVGQTVPLQVQVMPAGFQEWGFQSDSMEGLEVEFYQKDPTTSARTLLGTGITDADGVAKIHYPVKQDTPLHLVYRIKNDPRGFQKNDGKLEILSRQKPVIAIDLDGLRRSHFYLWGGTVEAIRRLISSGYQPVVLVNNTHDTGNYSEIVKRLGSLGIPVVYSSFKTGVSSASRKGFDETQLENLKRLKFESGIPIAGVWTRDLDYSESYRIAGIEVIPLDETMEQHQQKITQYHQEFLSRTTSPNFDPEEFYWDGMTGSQWRERNEFALLAGKEEAALVLQQILRAARSFITFQSVTLIDDPFGNKIRDILAEKARGEAGRPPIPVRLVLDGLLGNIVFPTSDGLSRTDGDDIDLLKKNGVQVVEHDPYEYFDIDESLFGVMTRLHTKYLVADAADGVVAFGGGRHPSTSYFGTKGSDRRTFNWAERGFGIDQGPYEDLSYTVRGPIARDIHEEVIRNFEFYQERRLPDAEKKRLLRPELYASPVSGKTPARLVLHHPYQNQNCLDLLLHFLESPSSTDIVIVNSFIPSPVLGEAMKRAAREGKRVRWIVGGLARIYDGQRDKRFQEFLDAGVEIYRVTYKLHTKLYGTNQYYAFGNHNIDTFSLRDVEDLLMIPKDSEGGGQVTQYLEKLLREATPLSAHPG